MAFLGLVYAFMPEDTINWEKISNNPNELSNLLSYVLMLIFFYLNYYFIAPQYLIKNHTFRFLALIITGFVIIITVSNNIPWTAFTNPPTHPAPHSDKHLPPPDYRPLPPDDKMPPPHNSGKPPSGKFFFGKSLILFLIGVFYTTALKSNEYKNKLEKEKIETELRYLKAQIDPHFLFNTLNSIYSLAIDENAFSSGNAIIRLSDMMRYVLTDTQHTFVSLTKEIDYLVSYIELQKLRFGNTVTVKFEKTGNFENKKIAPLLLIPFIENAFKYGINPEKESVVNIWLNSLENNLTVTITNKKARQKNIESTGLGIKNTSQRLKLLYPDKHTLVIDETDDNYSVTLFLNLTHNS
jgi:hypothetical protein